MAPVLSHSASVYERTIEYIFSGEVEPGAKLIEREYSKILGASRIPVREALTRLVARGVLVRDPRNRSVRMRQYHADEVSELLEYREAIEVASVRVACEKSRTNDLIRLELICDQMEEMIGQRISQAWIDLDRRFHQTIVSASGNSRFIEDFSLLIAESHYVFYLHPARRHLSAQNDASIDPRLRQVVRDHRRILKSMRAGDVDTAVCDLREHLRTASERLSRDILKIEFDTAGLP